MTDPSTNFFSKLKLVCRNIEHGISQLQNDVETRTSSRSAGKAVMKLSSLKQEIQQMKTDGRQKCQNLDEDGKKFNELMACCQSLLDIQNNKLQNIELFMKQYGYKAYRSTNKTDKKEEESIDEEEIIEGKENQKPTTPPQEVKPNRTRTPKPEDFGFSSYTLRAMERGFNNVIQQDFTTRAKTQPHSDARIPSVFNEHEFVSLTPSVFGRHVPFHTPGKYQDASPSFCDFFTPADKGRNPEQKYGSDLPKLDLYVASPEPPVFQTPGVKHLGKKDNYEMPPNAVKSNIQKSFLDSPQVPVFKSESARKMMEKKSVNHTELDVKTSRARLYDELPQTPEFTCNIRNLKEMSGFTKEPQLMRTDLQKENREPAPLTFLSKEISDTITTMPREFQPLTDHHDVTSNVTPPMPEMTSDRLSKFKSNNQQSRDLSKTPPTPKFLSQYANDLMQKN